MSPSELWRIAAELQHNHGAQAKKVALRQAVHAKRNNQLEQMDEWIMVASRIPLVASLHQQKASGELRS